ncbi:hypothetical protein BK809_0000263 [Diplodia seriata]|uniref:Cytochrome p450 n=1 Tax=Diplodia seriata TaxID=420778 RepID=A0A1S8BCE2_9PEZI|nr:hypothetical protein BK809_0000263 [Diplodia seriata]
MGCPSGKISLPSQLQARALPNKKLQIAFGIDNAFTTTDIHWYKEFRRLSESHLRMSTSQWRSVAKTARQIAIDGVRCHPGSISLSPLVQTLTLKISLHLFFGVDATTRTNDSNICFIAAEINRIWLASKQQQQTQPWHTNPALHAALRAAIPDRDPLAPRANPMNLILPSYETMWRVVLRCLVEVRFRPHAAAAPRWRSALATFLADASPHVFNEEVVVPADGQAVSAAAVAKEALRLYPPTRRVYRDLPPPVGGVAADVEALHRRSHGRSGGSSGRDSSAGAAHDLCTFRPERWVGGGTGDGDADVLGPFMAFGGARFLCPAGAAFGPMMVGVLVGALLEGLRVGEGEGEGQGEFEVEGRGYVGEMAGGEPLRSDREAYGDMRVVMRK